MSLFSLFFRTKVEDMYRQTNVVAKDDKDKKTSRLARSVGFLSFSFLEAAAALLYEVGFEKKNQMPRRDPGHRLGGGNCIRSSGQRGGRKDPFRFH